MKHLFLLPALLLAALAGSAQDTIYTEKGGVIIAKVIEVDPETVHIRVQSGTEEHDQVISKKDLSYIVYKGGLGEAYMRNSPARNKEIRKSAVPEPFPKNIVAINCFDMAFSNLTLYYERILGKGMVGIKIPVSVGLGGKPNTSEYESKATNINFTENRLYSTGLELNIYPFGQHRSTFYFGFSGEIGNFWYYRNVYDSVYHTSAYGSYYTYSVSGQERHIGTHIAGLVHMGSDIGITNNLLAGAKIGIGYKSQQTVFTDYTMFKAQFDVHIAYRF